MDYDDETHTEDKAWLWPRFCAAVWDSLAQHAARDLVSFRRLCDKLWRPFVQPIVAGDFGTRDFSRLLVAQRRLLQDENVLLDSIITPKSSIVATTEPQSTATTKSKTPPSLPYYTAYLLIAAYLASHNPARADQTFFMKHSETRKKRRRSSKAASAAATTARNTSNPHRNTPRHLLAPSPFPLDRWLSIFHALLPHPIRAGSLDMGTQIATLMRLRLVVRSGIGAGDVLDASGKWKVGAMVGWEYVSALAGGVGVRVGDYLDE